MKPAAEKEDGPNVRSLFLGALDKPMGPERAAYLHQACGENTELRARVEALLKAHDEAGGFLRPMAIGLETSAPAEGPGTVIGRYKLLERIGEGGMAIVYMAEQEQPIRRKVALKIIKLGMDTKQVIARFEAERQALALMDHPNIAKVFDGGATATGRPYFVMELVTGVSITEYCDKNCLSTKDRLALFVQVCQAVQHAHQKGIIHRDIKPSNVMVTHHDGKPVPKVIDFGIAKATNQKLTEKTLFTRYAHIIGTPAYMSPEQAELSDLDIDTRTDIYSLGVLLYELLTGTTPFSEEELRKAGYVEMQRVIREQEPVRPSTKLSTLGETLTDIAKHRNCTPDLLRRSVRGDPDWIVMKSLEKDRARRYETAIGLAEDVRRHLEHEPILARGPSATYRLQKFLRRHRGRAIAGMATAVVALLMLVTLSMLRGAQLQLNEQRDRRILSEAHEQYARRDLQAARETVAPVLPSRHVGLEARLLKATILVDNRQFGEATSVLNGLLDAPPAIAGNAYVLLVRILLEGESPDAGKLKQIEEYRLKAEALLPKTAEAYFLRAMTAMTVKEQLAALDTALELDPKHYEARRLRAFTYYASRKYEKMKDDALVMQILSDGDPLAYSLRAIALRELGRYPEAIGHYDKAIEHTPKGSPQHLDLATQRCGTLLRQGAYEQVIVDAEHYLSLWPNAAVFQYDIFAALTALGDYDKARVRFRQIVAAEPTARTQLWNWCATYVFDTLAAGRSWHPLDHEPAGAVFLPMVEAEETYRNLAAKGRRLTVGGFGLCWSPDGKKLAFGLGVLGYSGVATYDLDTNQTELLISPGLDPKYSPDGNYIAFVRDRAFLRMEELATANPENMRGGVNDEVWVMNADGTEPRRLARGGWPSWSDDSTTIYYHSRVDNTLYSVLVEGQNSEPKRIMPCGNPYPSVSPDNKWVAYVNRSSLTVRDLASQAVVAQLSVPSAAWGGYWSAKGQEMCLGGRNYSDDRTGLWVCRLDGTEPVRVLGGQITVGARTDDGTKLAFCLGPPYFEIWVADVDANVPLTESLGPGQRLEEHFREMLAFYTRRIESDPLDAYAYSRRARYYDYLDNRAEANADMARWSTAASGQLPCDFRHVVDMPFNCELVFSAERPVNAIPMMSVAFGQKGRCDMKVGKIPLFIVSLLGFNLLSALDTAPAYADFTFGEPTNLGPAINSSASEYASYVSADGLEFYFTRGQSRFDIWVARRASLDSEWGPAVSIGAPINSADNGEPFLTADGLTLLFSGDRPGTYGSFDLWTTTRVTKSDAWGTPVNFGATVNSSAEEWGASLSADGLELYFTSNRAGGSGSYDLWMTRRASVNDDWSTATNLGPSLNTPYNDTFPSISPDSLVLFFASTRPGGFGTMNLYMTRRATTKDSWGPPTNLGPTVNSNKAENGVRVSADGSLLLFFSDREDGLGSFDVWQAPILPILDFDGDGKVDAADMAILSDNWGQGTSLCDIAPFAWGDGVVDEKDLNVLMEAMASPVSGASDVCSGTVLSWIGPSFAAGYDVYLGTTLESVSAASRDDPCGVLVSEWQLETTYVPEERLEFSQTYFWRIDTIGGPSGVGIYKGSVWSFTTGPYAYPVQDVAASASGAEDGAGPENTVNGSGLDAAEQHSNKDADMWTVTPSAADPVWIQYEFDSVYKLSEMRVWNHNTQWEAYLGFGLKDVTVEYSADGSEWTSLGDFQLARAPGASTYAGESIDLAGISAKSVRIVAISNYGGPKYGLGEVKFFYIPTRASYPQPADEETGVAPDVTLTWRAGREATSHEVYLSTDKQAVLDGTALIDTVAASSHQPDTLDPGQTYYWKITEVNEAEIPSRWEGDVWEFTTSD